MNKFSVKKILVAAAMLGTVALSTSAHAAYCWEGSRATCYITAAGSSTGVGTTFSAARSNMQSNARCPSRLDAVVWMSIADYYTRNPTRYTSKGNYNCVSSY